MDLDQLVEKAKQAYGNKKYKEAADLFGQAADDYVSKNDDLMAAEMKNNQSVAHLQAGNAQASLEAVLGTDEVFASAGDKRRQGMAVANKAAALGDLKRTEEALSFYEKSATILEEAGEPDLRADVMRSVATLRVRQNKITDAVVSKKQRILEKLSLLRLWLKG